LVVASHMRTPRRQDPPPTKPTPPLQPPPAAARTSAQRAEMPKGPSFMPPPLPDTGAMDALTQIETDGAPQEHDDQVKLS
jgi:hypothetical protein